MKLQRQLKQAFITAMAMFSSAIVLTAWTPQGMLAFNSSQTTQGAAVNETNINGTWKLYVGKLGEEAAMMSSSFPFVSITIQTQGNKLLGSVSVPKVNPGETGVTIDGFIQFPLLNLSYSNGRTLSFKVDDRGNTLEASLTKISDTEFVGDWKSPINGPWKSSKSQASGKLILKR